MILDYNYNSYSRKLDLSYITDKGSKQILSFNVNRFKSYYSTPNGKFTNWDGSKCDVKWVEKPSKFEIKTFLTELDDKYKDILNGKTFPKVYTFDIEVLKDSTGEYADAAVASGEISTISICSPDFNTIVLGTLQMSDMEKKVLDENYAEYLKNTEFFQSLNVTKQPYVKYVQFTNEEEMLKYFLSNIISKVPIIAGWNSIKYDWQYIVNRIRRCYPSLSVKMASCNRRVNNQTYKDKYGNNITLPMPEHTIILDMMDVIETHDKNVLPMKESMKLDYIASESMGIHKIEYTKSLDDLYESDYGRYVFYNSIDSLLVQLINCRFKTLDSIYLIARYCNEKISNCFGKIAITEALVFKDFYEHDLKIVYEEQNPVRGKLVGAYVKKPVFGIHNWVCCNDFAALYPSTIRTCNLSFENYVGAFWDEEKLAKYKAMPRMYAVIGPNVFENEEKDDVKVKAGQLLYTFIDEEKIKQYRNNPNYFVTVNGCVYKNDKDYSFRRIQTALQEARNKDKYLKQDIEAYVVSDIKHILENRKPKERKYSEKIVNQLASIGLDITCTADLYNFNDLESLKKKVSDEVVYLDSSQKAMKDIMNSMYGGSSHINFYWYNMNLANDITGEARNLIHIMEHHIPDWFRNNWADAKDLHDMLGIMVDKKHALDVLNECREITEEEDINAYHKKSYVMPVYGDTDSVHNESVIRITSSDSLSNREIQIGKWFEENENNDKITLQNGTELVKTNDKVLNWSKEKGLHYDNVNYIMRHKVTKPKWKIKTKDGKEIIVTNDHSMIVFRDGKQLEVKPHEILKTDKILVINN